MTISNSSKESTGVVYSEDGGGGQGCPNGDGILRSSSRGLVCECAWVLRRIDSVRFKTVTKLHISKLLPPPDLQLPESQAALQSLTEADYLTQTIQASG